MKKTECDQWVHVSCTDAISELFYNDVVNKDNVSSVVRRSFPLKFTSPLLRSFAL